MNSSLYQRGLTFDGDNGLAAFQSAAASGTLPEVSWVFPPGALQEHSPNAPNDGAWFINQIVDAAIHGKNYNETIVMINYDGKQSLLFILYERDLQNLTMGGRGWWLG